MPPKITVFSTLSTQQKNIFYRYFIENDTQFVYNPKSNTYIATIVSSLPTQEKAGSRAASTSRASSTGGDSEKGVLKTLLTEYGSLVTELGCKPSSAQTQVLLDITSLLRFMTHLYEEHYHEFVGVNLGSDPPAFLKGAPSGGLGHASVSNKAYHSFINFILSSMSLTLYRNTLKPASAGTSPSAFMWTVLMNLNKYKATSVFVSAFLLLLTHTSKNTPTNILILYSSLQHELKEQIIRASQTQLQAKPLIQVASRVLGTEARTQKFISIIVDRYQSFLAEGMDSTVFGREFLLFCIEAASRGESWVQVGNEPMLYGNCLTGASNATTVQGAIGASSILQPDTPVYPALSAPMTPGKPESNPLLAKLAADSPFDTLDTPQSEAKLRRSGALNRSRVSGFHGAFDDEDDFLSSISQSAYRRRLVPHDEIYPSTFNTAFMTDETSFVTLQEGLTMVLPSVTKLFCEHFKIDPVQTDENMSLLVQELIANSDTTEVGDSVEIRLRRAWRDLRRAEIHTAKTIMQFVRELLQCLGERMGIGQDQVMETPAPAPITAVTGE